MENSDTLEIFEVMGKLRSKFNALISGNISLDRYSEEEHSENFRGAYEHFALSGGRLNPGENLVNGDGVATVTQDIQFRMKIFPRNIDDVQPLRLEVDSQHRVGPNKIIHINPAGGGVIEIPHNDVEELCPEYCIDLVRISGSRYFREAIDQSLEYWKE